MVTVVEKAGCMPPVRLQRASLYGRAATLAVVIASVPSLPPSQTRNSTMCPLLPLDTLVELIANAFDVARAVLLHISDSTVGYGEHLPS